MGKGHLPNYINPRQLQIHQYTAALICPKVEVCIIIEEEEEENRKDGKIERVQKRK
jgi:hypothetical protein